MIVLLLLHLISLSSVSFGQFYGAHRLGAGHSGLALSPYGNGDSEALPISQAELAQLMAQSLATSSGKNFGPPSSSHKQNEESDNDDFGSNYDGADDGPEGPQPPQPPQQPDEENNEGGDEQGNYEQQEGGEGSPYQQHGQTEGEQGGSDDRENSEAYENSRPNYQGEGQNIDQSGQYLQSSYGSQSEEQQREPHSGAYDDNQRGSQYDSPTSQHYGPQSASNGYQNDPRYRSHSNAVNPRGPQYSNEFTFSAPGAGYDGPGSESYIAYDFRNSPKSMRFRS